MVWRKGIKGGLAKEKDTSVDEIFSASGEGKGKVYEGDLESTDNVAEGEVNPIFKDGKFGKGAGCNSKDPIFEGGEFGEDAGYDAGNPIFKDGKFGDRAGKSSGHPIFEKGKFGDHTGSHSENPIFKGGEFERLAGHRAKGPIFRGGKFGNMAGHVSKNPIFEKGNFGDTAGQASREAIFKGGKFKNNTGYDSFNAIVVGGDYKKFTLNEAKNVKAFISKAKSISTPNDGWVIAGDVDEIQNKRDCVIIKTKEGKCKISGKNVFYVTKDYLNECLKKVGFKKFKKINDHAQLSKEMDKLFELVKEKSYPAPEK